MCKLHLLPTNMDPDDYIMELADKPFVIKLSKIHIRICHSLWRMQNVLKTYLMKMMYCNLYMKFSKNLAKRVSPVERDLYIRQLSTETNISVEAITQQFMKMAGNRARQAKANL